MTAREPRKRPRETVAEFIRRRNPTAALPVKVLPAWVFSWWFALLFVLIMIGLPLGSAILWTFPK